jgi:hypothetical protein
MTLVQKAVEELERLIRFNQERVLVSMSWYWIEVHGPAVLAELRSRPSAVYDAYIAMRTELCPLQRPGETEIEALRRLVADAEKWWVLQEAQL